MTENNDPLLWNRTQLIPSMMPHDSAFKKYERIFNQPKRILQLQSIIIMIIKKTFPNDLPQTLSFLSKYTNSLQLKRAPMSCSALWPCLALTLSVIQSVNEEGGTNQQLHPIGGQLSHQSIMTSSLVRKGQAKRKTIHTFLPQRHIM